MDSAIPEYSDLLTDCDLLRGFACRELCQHLLDHILVCRFLQREFEDSLKADVTRLE
jgi:hypothetical protein